MVTAHRRRGDRRGKKIGILGMGMVMASARNLVRKDRSLSVQGNVSAK
ncbi:MAG: hypothetical protein ABSB22_14370 [Thermodesulfobacteriota bacterium]